MQFEHDDLASAGVVPHPDLSVQLRIGGLAVDGEYHDHPAWVLTAGGIGRLDGLLEDGFAVWRDDQGEDPGHRERATLFAQPVEFLVDRVGRGVLEIDDHGRLHSLPDRCNISNAESGPQPPDS
ncbi:Uncharacterised protein [Mycobacteroides abscessus subsp. abscessus]|nr:Uncharacterised protein [Mycobacteroides abscessus subsp. abscessus]